VSLTLYLGGASVLLFLIALFGVLTWREALARHSFMLGMLSFALMLVIVLQHRFL
jgi:hypothetical protein